MKSGNDNRDNNLYDNDDDDDDDNHDHSDALIFMDYWYDCH